MTTPDTQLFPALLGLEEDGPSVVAIGGGAGLAQVLVAAQTYAGEITGIVSVADDGGSSGRLLDGLDIPPPGDVRKALLSLADPSLLSELFAYRFEASDVSGHSLGNLLLAALADLTGDFTHALDVAADLLGAHGRVLPAANHR
ncbi:MAG: 2-phospho-L-lactate transferase CofD family protein, partial [Acidimicrobiia bacterium]